RPPAGPLEKVIAAVWSEVLGVDQVGTDDDFFHLGGHSLHAVQVCGRLERTLRTPVSVRQLVERPTIPALAQRLRTDSDDPVQLERIAEVVMQVYQLDPTERAARLDGSTRVH